jgi:nucleoside-diphosphate-sugar epimerase
VNPTYQSQEVLITGGLGFLGSNLAIRLVNLGARVTVVDALVNGCGGNLHNIASVSGCVRVIQGNIGDTRRLRNVIRRAKIIFNLAGEVSHSHSMRFPKRDALLNTSNHLSFLEECSSTAPGVRIVYAGTRQIYGIPQYLPLDEDHPVCPVDFNGIHKYAAVMYHQLYARLGKLDSFVLNLTNLYGPRMALSVPCQGFLANFVRKLMTRQNLEVFGDGSQLRDPLYVDDAVEAFLTLGLAKRPAFNLYNVGGPEPLEIGEIARVASRIAGVHPPAFRPFPPETKCIDIGSYYADCSRIQQEFHWVPSMKFKEGIERTLSFYSQEMAHYIDPAHDGVCCLLDCRHA